MTYPNGVQKAAVSWTVLLSALVLLLPLGGCGGTVEPLPGDNSATGGSGGTTMGSGGSGGSPFATGGAATGGDGTGGEPYVEPDCPDEPPPPTIVECDPLQPEVDCGTGFSCVPYLEYPYGQGCGVAGYGSVCVFAGSAEQGDFCETENCAPGYMCVVGAAGGKRCGKICQPVADHGCPDGLVCGETDVQGYGVCF